MEEARVWAVGRSIAKFRTAAKITREWLAEQIDCSVSHISRVENGQRAISLPLLFPLSDTLKVPPARLFLDENIGIVDSTVSKKNLLGEVLRAVALLGEEDLRAVLGIVLQLLKH